MLLQNILFALLLLSCDAALSRNPFHSRLAFRNLPSSVTQVQFSEASSILSIPLTSDSNGIYTNLFLGSDKHNYKMLLDTTYLWSTLMPQDASSSTDKNLFDCALSQTCKTIISDLTNITFKSHHFGCYVVEEQASLSDNAFSFQFLTTSLGDFQDYITSLQVSGALGLRLMKPGTEEDEKTLSKLGVEANSLNFVQAIKNKGLVEKAQFSIYLSSSQAKTSTLVIGGYDPNTINGTASEIPVTAENNWALNVTRISVGKSKLPLKTSTAIISTLVQGLIFPQAAINSIYDYLIAASLCTSFKDSICFCGQDPCGYNPDYFPDLSISFQGFQANISGRAYIRNKDGTNELLIRKNEGTDNFIWLGHIFIQQYVPLFNIETQTISLVQSIDYIPSSGLNSDVPYYILIVAIILVAIIGLGFFCFNKNREKHRVRSESETLLNSSTDSHKKSFDHIGL